MWDIHVSGAIHGSMEIDNASRFDRMFLGFERLLLAGLMGSIELKKS